MGLQRGDIIKVSLSPTHGHEQSGFRPVVIIANNVFIQKTQGMAIVCPITNTERDFPLHVKLDDRTMTTGEVLCEQVRTIDTNAREWRFVEKLPEDILHKVIEIVKAEI